MSFVNLLPKKEKGNHLKLHNLYYCLINMYYSKLEIYVHRCIYQTALIIYFENVDFIYVYDEILFYVCQR